MRSLSADLYPSALAHWVLFPHPVSLGPGKSVQDAQPLLELTLKAAFTGVELTDVSGAKNCLAGLLLRMDFLEASHQISQSVDTSTGSFWHGIMHRRESDFGNSKYWFHQVGQHPVLNELRQDAHELGFESYDPYRFVDAVQTGENVALLQAVQEREWALLFDYSFKEATGAA